MSPRGGLESVNKAIWYNIAMDQSFELFDAKAYTGKQLRPTVSNFKAALCSISDCCLYL